MTLLLPTAEVARVTGATIRMIDHWARTGVLRPSGQDATGKGSRRLYTFQDVVVLQAVRTLRRCNCPLQKIRTAIRYLKAHYPAQTQAEALAKLTLLTDGKRVYLLTDDRQIMDASTRQLQISAWVVYIGKLILDTNERLESRVHNWSERVIISGKVLHFDVERSHGPRVVARCRELPGALVEGMSVEQVNKDLKRLVSSVLAHDALGRQARSNVRANARA